MAFPKISFPFFTRNIKGDTFYQINQFQNWGVLGATNLDVALNHPILTPAILFISKLFAQANFHMIDKKTGKRVDDHWLIDLLKEPNYYQTQNDFLEAQQFTQVAQGQAIVWVRRTTGVANPTALYLLNPNLLEYPDEFRTPLRSANDANKIKNKLVLYDRDGENQKIPFKDLLYLYDLPNGLNTENMFESCSRIDGLKQTLLNTVNSLLAKEVILKTNGKELITGDKSGSFPLSDEEKKAAEDVLHNKYGLGAGRKRGLVSKASLKWQSMHVPLRDLGLDESVKVDGNIIYTALHIPKDIISLEAKKTTYNNFKESMVSYIQNEMQPSLDAFIAVFQRLVKSEGLELAGNFDAMPIMEFVLLQRYEGVMKRGLALSALRNAGLPDEVCLEECGFDKGITLAELQIKENETTTQNQGAKTKFDSGQEEAIKIIARQEIEEF